MVQTGFYAWAIVALCMIFYLLSYSGKGKKLFPAYAAGLAVWLAYVALLGRSGVLEDFSLPPRLVLLIVLPAVAGCVFLTGREHFREVLTRTPAHVPVYLQSFRIVVEFLIYGAFVEGVFPERATFSGINFDILVGLSAPVIAFLYQGGRISEKGLLTWNLLSMLILSVTVYSFISTYYFSDYIARSGSTGFTKMPYLLLASVLLPVAVYLHIFSLRQIISHRKDLTKTRVASRHSEVVM